MIVRAALSLIETDVRFLHALKDAVLSDRRRTVKQAGPAAGRALHRQLFQPMLSDRAVSIWRSLDANGHAALVGLYLERAVFRDIGAEGLRDGSESDPLSAITARSGLRQPNCRFTASTTAFVLTFSRTYAT